MADYKYPYIPKRYYKPTMFACQIIRDTGQFNRAIKTASKYYKVDADKLEKHVRARQSAGQKGKKRGKYHWYAVRYVIADERNDYYEAEIATSKVVKALSKDNAIEQVHNKYDRYDRFPCWVIVGEAQEFDSQAEAETKVQEWNHDV